MGASGIRRRSEVIVELKWRGNVTVSSETSLGFSYFSSDSGRKVETTNQATKISTVGGSMRNGQLLACHSALSNTQRYIEGAEEMRHRVVELVLWSIMR